MCSSLEDQGKYFPKYCTTSQSLQRLRIPLAPLVANTWYCHLAVSVLSASLKDVYGTELCFNVHCSDYY